MGMGKQPEEITIESPMFRAVSVQYEQAIGAAADVLGLDDRRDPPRGRDRHVDPTTSRSRAARCLPARSSGRSCRGPAYRDGEPVLVAEEYWTVTRDIPGWDLELEQASSSCG